MCAGLCNAIRSGLKGGKMMNDEQRKTDKQAHKLGADRHDAAKKPDQKHGKHKTSKDIHEDRGIRQHKLSERKN